jgi:hypothetical protein
MVVSTGMITPAKALIQLSLRLLTDIICRVAKKSVNR